MTRAHFGLLSAAIWLLAATAAAQPTFETVFEHPNDGEATLRNRVIDLINNEMRCQSTGCFELLVGSYFLVSADTGVSDPTQDGLFQAITGAADRGAWTFFLSESQHDADTPEQIAFINALRNYPAGTLSVDTCNGGCLRSTSTSKNHNKYWAYLNSEGKAIIYSSSGNLHAGAANKFQDAVIVRNRVDLTNAFIDYFSAQWAGVAGNANWNYRRVVDGPTIGYFFPRTCEGGPPDCDTAWRILDNVDPEAGGCKIRVAMGTWTASGGSTGRDGTELARKLDELGERGCTVQANVRNKKANSILWDDPDSDPITLHLETDGTTYFGRHVDMARVDYLHSKFLLIDAMYAGSRRRLVWAGSHNFTRSGLQYNGEVWLRLDDATTFDRYWSEWAGHRDVATFDASEAELQVTALRYDAPGSDIAGRNGEFVQVTNVSNQFQPTCGWSIRDAAGNERIPFSEWCPVFGPFIGLGPSQSVRIYTGCDDGSPGNDPVSNWSGTIFEDFWCRSNVWNNTGDTVEVRRWTGSGWSSERTLRYVP